MRYEAQYISNLKSILNYGSREMNQRTGIITRRAPSSQIVVDLEYEFPILQSKKVYWKSAVDEILWIMQKQSNVTAELNSKIWDAWTGEDGTIGKSYGYQVKQQFKKDGTWFNNQVEYVLETLKKDPSNRQCVINLWNVSELADMNLVPCCYSSVWSIIDGHLNCMLVQRSADYPIGVPFDTTQYAALTCMFARHLGVRPGILTHVMADSHIYENQVGGVMKQLQQYNEWLDKDLYVNVPRLVFKEDAPTDFWKMSLDDLMVVDYDPLPPIKFEVAV